MTVRDHAAAGAQRFRALGLVTRIVSVALILVLVAVGVFVYLQNRDKTGVAYFETVKNLYPKDRVKMLGVDVGEIDSITPEPGRVRIEFSYDSKYSLPAEANAAIVTPTLVATRYLQVGPAYKGGPALPDGGVIPVDRTASPLEFDDLKTELSKVAKDLGPHGADRQGAFSRFLQVSAANAGGRGQQFNDTIKSASAALQTLADGREDLFGTIRNLQVFVGALGAINQQVVEFNGRLDDVTGALNDDRDELGSAIQGIDQAAAAVDDFVRTNGSQTTQAVDQLGQFNQALAAQRDRLAQVLHIAPNAIQNFLNIFSPASNAVTGTLTVNNLNTPADFVCSAFAAAAANDQHAATGQCASTLGPLLNYLRVQQPPIGVNPIHRPGGGNAQPAPGTPDTVPASPGPDSGLPPSSDIPGLGGLTTGGN